MISMRFAVAVAGSVAAFLGGAEAARWSLAPLTDRLNAPMAQAMSPTPAFAAANAVEPAAQAPPVTPIVTAAQPGPWTSPDDAPARTREADTPSTSTDLALAAADDGGDRGDDAAPGPTTAIDGFAPPERPWESAGAAPPETEPDR